MLVTMFLKIVEALIAGVNHLLPDIPLPIWLLNMLTDFGNFCLGFNAFFPMQTLLTIVSSMILFEVGISIARIILGFISLVRGGGDAKV